MVFFTDVHDAPDPTAFADDKVSDTVLAEVQASSPGWIPVQGGLVNVLLDLSQRPGVTLVRVGETKDPLSQPLYLARAAHQGNIYLGVCGFHLAGARIAVDGRDTIATRYKVLSGTSDEFEWQDFKEVNDLSPVRGACIERAPSKVEHHIISRRHVGESVVYGSVSVLGDTHSPLHVGDSVADGCGYEILVHSKASKHPKSAPQEPEDRIQVINGRFLTDNHYSHVKQGDRHSTTIHFDIPLKSVPRLITGFDELDMGHHDSAIRLRSYTQNATKENFVLNADSWGNTRLYNCGTTWAAITEPTWQCGVLKTAHGGDLWLNPIKFSPPFSSPPMVFACLSGLDVTGSFEVRVHVTRVDHMGCNVSLPRPKDAGVGVVSISWIAIPGHEVLSRKNAWIGSFSTDSLPPKYGSQNQEWTGSVKFGFEFKRKPKVFFGIDHFKFDHGRNIRLRVSVSKVSKSGMDWTMKTRNDSVMSGGGVTFLAIDTT